MTNNLFNIFSYNFELEIPANKINESEDFKLGTKEKSLISPYIFSGFNLSNILFEFTPIHYPTF